MHSASARHKKLMKKTIFPVFASTVPKIEYRSKKRLWLRSSLVITGFCCHRFKCWLKRDSAFLQFQYGFRRLKLQNAKNIICWTVYPLVVATGD
jgi:hypothetical protein